MLLAVMLVILAVGAFCTWFASIARQESIEKGRIIKVKTRAIYHILASIGPTGVLIISGAALLITLIVAIRIIKNPPVMMRIKPAR